jgi:predicted GNAT family acetyltransferase
VVDNAATSRFELSVSGDTAFLQYGRTSDALTLIHTEVPTAIRGRGLGGLLVRVAFQSARSAGLRIVVVCPFARAYLKKHPPDR